MKKLLFFVLIATTTFSVHAQTGAAKPLKKVMDLLMPRTADDDMPGTRGASVVWHPLQKKYYASMAGNAGYPMGVYDAKGVKLSSDDLDCDVDTRGLWFNPVKKQIQGNGYDENGWFGYTLNAKGIPISSDVFMEGMNQPDAQSVGAFNPAKKEVLFLSAGYVSFYSMEDGTSNNSLRINWGRKKADGPIPEEEEAETPEDYNNSTVVYTGIKGSELGFLNTMEMQIELYNIADGFMTKALKLPEDAPMNSSFNFAYTNGMYWLFSIEMRTWTAYK